MEDGKKKVKQLRKSLHIYLSKKLTLSPNHPASAIGSRLFSACKHPRTPSFAAGRGADDLGATLSDVDRLAFASFPSCFAASPGTTSTFPANETRPSGGTSQQQSSSSSSSSAPPGPLPLPPRLAPARDARGAGSEEEGAGVAVMTFSLDPYTDFRRSMQKMMEMHHGESAGPLDWDFMEELLFYYLQLNERSVHKHILKAFSDLTSGFRRGGTAHRRVRRAGKSVRSRKHPSREGASQN